MSRQESRGVRKHQEVLRGVIRYEEASRGVQISQEESGVKKKVIKFGLLRETP